MIEAPTVVDPLSYPQWDEQLIEANGASFFHGSAWARVVRDTYGHTPLYFCRFRRGKLMQLLPVMEVTSLLTGRRGVSLPFVDFCFPLCNASDGLQKLYNFATEFGRERKWRYFETRGFFDKSDAAVESIRYFSHSIPLNADQEGLHRRCDGATRRAIRRAEKSGVRVEFGASKECVDTFYALHCQTRRRHGAPPQSKRFFENIAQHILKCGRGVVAIALYKQRPIAGAVFFQQGKHAVFKFGASDCNFQNLRPNNLLIWQGIARFASEGVTVLDLGRTSVANKGLRRYKLGWGSEERIVHYVKYDFVKGAFVSDHDRAYGWHTGIFRRLPVAINRLIGTTLYQHLS